MIAPLRIDTIRLDMGEFALSLQHVSRRVGPRLVLDGIELDVKRGTCVVVSGPGGAGKSALLACIAGASRATSGRVRFRGYELRGKSESRIARMGIARVRQEPRAFAGMNVLENVTVAALLRRPRLADARRHACAVIERSGLGACAHAPAAGLDAARLRRLEFARALATDPFLLLVDDAPGGMRSDLATFGQLIGELVAGGATVVAAAREGAPLRTFADRVVSLHAGQLVAPAFAEATARAL